MVKVYDMTNGELLSGSTAATFYYASDEACPAWSDPAEEPVREQVARRDYAGIPELALQLIEVR